MMPTAISWHVAKRPQRPDQRLDRPVELYLLHRHQQAQKRY